MVHVSYTSQLFDEEGQIVALCPELNVSSFGDTPEEALASLREAVTLFLEECQQMGTLEMVLGDQDQPPQGACDTHPHQYDDRRDEQRAVF